MHQIAANSPTLLPRHYYQVALDFKRLSKRISASKKSHGSHGLVLVKNPATVLTDWDKTFQGCTRTLAKIFHNLTTQILSTTSPLQHIDTVKALVPLEQRVYRLLTLREMVQKHHFPQGWQRGQVLFLARIDKILSGLQRILHYFNLLVEHSKQDHLPTGTHVWDGEVECCTQSKAFYGWCQEMDCSVPLPYFCKTMLRRTVEQIRNRYFEPVLRVWPVPFFTVR